MDCNDAVYDLNNVTQGDVYPDADGDGYGAGTVQTACVATGFSPNNTDCYDANPATTNAELAYPGSSTCSTANRGDGSYDYNCSSTGTTCDITRYSSLGSVADGWYVQGYTEGGRPTCGTGGFATRYTFSGSTSCGVSGYYCTSSQYVAKTTTEVDYGCIVGGYIDYCLANGTAAQSCQ